MNWWVKGVIYALKIDKIRNAFIAKSNPNQVTDACFLDELASHTWAVSNFCPKENLVGAEIGAGYGLSHALGLSNVLTKQYCYDIENHLNLEQIQANAKALLKLDKIDLMSLGIEINTSFDYKNYPDFSNRNVFFHSTNTFEHIPPSSLKRILENIFFTPSLSTTLSTIIDFTDHYSHSDATVPCTQQYELNPKIRNLLYSGGGYHNCLLDSDYQALFSELGLNVLHKEALGSTALPNSGNMHLNKNCFNGTLAMKMQYVLRKR